MINGGHRGIFKQRALQAGWPVEDLAGFLTGAPLEIELRDTMIGNGKPFAVRHYQAEAASRWYQDGRPSGGCGVVVLACGAGKTIVGIESMRHVQTKTLILATNQAAVNQWVREIIDKTHLTADQVGAYTGEIKEIKPVTVATYQILTWRRSKEAEFEHLHLFEDEDWGLLIYDEVHSCPPQSSARPQDCKPAGDSDSRPPWFVRMVVKAMSSASSAQSGTTYRGRCFSRMASSPRLHAPRSECHS